MVGNASPLSVLPQFVEVLGRKLDKVGGELDSWDVVNSCGFTSFWHYPLVMGLAGPIEEPSHH